MVAGCGAAATGKVIRARKWYRPHANLGRDVPGSRRLNRSHIEDEGAGILACEPKGRHVGMVDHETLAQSFHERVEIDPAIEPTERRSVGMRALTAAANGMAGRAHLLGERPASLFERARPGFLSQSNRYSEQQEQND
jgi:hypothetical protein